MAVTVERERPNTPGATALILELEAHLTALYPAESRHGFSVERLVAEDVHFFVLRTDGVPAGCGGILFVDDPAGPYGEIKRMYVRPGSRGSGFGRRILDALIGHARERGITLLRLETGIHQREAIGLYESRGFRPAPPFGPYREDPLSPCYELRLGQAVPAPSPVTRGGSMQQARVTSGRLCEDAIRAFDRLCELERRRVGDGESMTPRQRHRRRLLEVRASANEWIVPGPLAATVAELVAAADRIDDPALAHVWTDHLPVAVLACLERRSMARRVADHDPFVAAS